MSNYSCQDWIAGICFLTVILELPKICDTRLIPAILAKFCYWQDMSGLATMPKSPFKSLSQLAHFSTIVKTLS